MVVVVVASAGAVPPPEAAPVGAPPLAGPALPDEDTLSFSLPDVDAADGWPEPTESLDTMAVCCCRLVLRTHGFYAELPASDVKQNPLTFELSDAFAVIASASASDLILPFFISTTTMRSVRTAAQHQRRRTMQVLLAFIFVVGFASSPANAFTAPASTSFGTSSARRTSRTTRRFSTADGDDDASSSASVRPQVFATGYSNNPDLHAALQQAVNSALAALPPLGGAEATRGRSDAKIDLAFVTASSLYNASPATVVPAVLSIASVYGQGIDKLVGCTSGGTISSVVGGDEGGASAVAAATASQSTGQGQGAAAAPDAAAAAAAAAAVRECLPVETEGVPGVSVTLALLPDVDVSTFHVLSEDVPDDVGRVSTQEWNNAIGLRDMGASKGEDDDDEPIFLLLPSPAFQSDLDDLLHGISVHHPHSSVIGGVASTVSSLSRAQLFRYDSADPNAQLTLGDGCIGAVLSGDIQVSTMLAQGAKPVGGIYRIVSGQDSTIGAIMLDEEATKEDAEAAEDLKDGAD